MSAVRIYVPRDAAARSMGAEDTAQAIAAEAQRREIDVQIVAMARAVCCGSSRWSKSKSAARRYAYGPVQPGRCRGVVRRRLPGVPAAACHRLAQGPTEEIPYFKRQERLTFARVGITDPRLGERLSAHDGYRGLTAALAMEPAQIVAERDGIGTARPRRRRISRRHQMEDGARRSGRPEIRRLQCR